MIDMQCPPTDYCIRILPFFKLLIGLQLLCVIGSFVINDWWGGLSLLIVCVMGWLCTTGEGGLSITSCLYYAVIAIMCGVFDLIRCIMYFQKSQYGMFDKAAPTLVHVAQATMLLSPIFEFISGYIAWSMYKDCRNAIEGPTQPLLPRNNMDRFNQPANNRPTQSTQQANTRAFSGEGQRLGNA